MRALYEELVNHYSDELYRYAYRFSGKSHVAEDLVAEAFTEAWRSISSLREPSKARAWLFQILRHRCSHWLRQRDRQVATVATPEEVPAEVSTVPLTLEHLAQKEALQQALDALPANYREPFLMVYLEGQSCQQVADALEVPLGTVLSRLHRAKEALRIRLAAFAENDRTQILTFPKEGAS